jgi:hypothetical protein
MKIKRLKKTALRIHPLHAASGGFGGRLAPVRAASGRISTLGRKGRGRTRGRY